MRKSISGPRVEAACWTIAVACLAGVPCATAQLHPPEESSSGYSAGTAGAAETEQRDPAQPGAAQPPPRPTPEQLRWRNLAVIGGGILLVGTYGALKWWEDGFTGEFRSVNEGWFGQDTYAGGADKMGHAYASYVGMRLATRAFEAVGNQPASARTLATWATLGVMTGIEVLDGYSKQYKFSAQDAVMNVAGVGLGWLLERNPALDSLLDFRLLYRRSSGSNFDPAGDYSGQKYLFVAKATGVAALRTHPVARYFELAAGYGTRGYQGPPGVERERNLYFGVSLNLSELLAQSVFRGAKERSGAQRATDLFLEFVQVPGTAALASHRL